MKNHLRRKKQMFFNQRKMPQSLGKKLTRNEFVVLNLSLALLLAYVTFLAGIDKTANRDGCVTAGAFIHYFFLVAFAWQAVEGFLLYKVFVATDANSHFTHFQSKTAALSWGIPLLIVAIVLIIRSDLYLGKNVYAEGRGWYFWNAVYFKFLSFFADVG
jgi:uncharacterized membrane protein